MPRFCLACEPLVQARWAAEERERQEQEAREQRQRRAEDWLRLCPAVYRRPDDGRLPAELAAAVAAWRYGPRGLAFCGQESGLGKTWAMFRLLERLFVEEGHRAVYLTATEFSHRVSRLSGEKMAQLDEFIGGLCRVPVLFLDDVGKGRLTDRVEAEFYHVVEERTKHERPILWTANVGGGELAALLSEERGVPIVRRLGEYCQVVQL